jgi:hypothetical protein
MTQRKNATSDDEWADTTATVTDNEWEDVFIESLIKFNTLGDEFIGTFQGWSETGNGITQAHWNSDEHGACFINMTADLKEKLKDARKGKIYRIRLVDFLDTGRDSPMMIFRVQTRKNPA